MKVQIVKNINYIFKVIVKQSYVNPILLLINHDFCYKTMSERGNFKFHDSKVKYMVRSGC